MLGLGVAEVAAGGQVSPNCQAGHSHSARSDQFEGEGVARVAVAVAGSAREVAAAMGLLERAKGLVVGWEEEVTGGAVAAAVVCSPRNEECV